MDMNDTYQTKVDAVFGTLKIKVHNTKGCGDNGDWPCTIEMDFGGQHGNGRGWPDIDSDTVTFSFAGPNMEWQTLPELLIAAGQELQRIRAEVLK